MDEVLGLRKSAKALEESFFAQENEKLLKKLREQAAEERKRELLRDALKITDDRILDHLVELEISVEAILALNLVPLVEVAWADGEIQDRERQAILRAAEERGIAADSINHKLLENWLKRQPEPALLEVWRHYVRALLKSLDEEEAATLRQRVLGNAAAIAESAGGFLGIGTISAAERAVLEDLAATFE
jgi:hypothetical protein